MCRVAALQCPDTAARCPDPAHHQLPDVAPSEVSPLMDNGQPDPPLEAVMEEELASTREVIRVVHQDRHVLPRRG